MKIFKNTAFHDWTKKLDISDKVLNEAIKEINLGRYEANWVEMFIKNVFS